MSFLLDAEQLLQVAANTIGGPVRVRDQAALRRAADAPAKLAADRGCVPDLFDEAAALLHAIATSRPLVDGNLRLAWSAARTTLYLNGIPANPVDPDQAETLVRAIAGNVHADISDIAARLRALSH